MLTCFHYRQQQRTKRSLCVFRAKAGDTKTETAFNMFKHYHKYSAPVGVLTMKLFAMDWILTQQLKFETLKGKRYRLSVHFFQFQTSKQVFLLINQIYATMSNKLKEGKWNQAHQVSIQKGAKWWSI